jgi:diphosphomevalonate decarboxylase
MPLQKATALAHPNIAFIKYWGNVDHNLRIPANPSLSMNLDGLHTQTLVTFNTSLTADMLTLNGRPVAGEGLARVSGLLDRVRSQAGIEMRASVESENNFPTGSGIASSASAFAALALAASIAAGLNLSEKELSALARTGSGSASRSIPAGFVEWHAGTDHASSYAESSAPPAHWDLVDLVVIVSKEHKKTGSTGGHSLADSSRLQAARIADAPRRYAICHKAILEKDFEAFAHIVEEDSNMMHAVMMTSTPPLLYWEPTTLTVMKTVIELRENIHLSVCYTIDAGPNVHVICLQDDENKAKERLHETAGVLDILRATPGGPAHLIDS